MSYELRELSGNIFNNRYKQADNQPDMKGEFLLNGVPHDIAIWQKQGPKGPFLGFKISPKRQKQEQPQSISQQAVAKIKRYPDDRITTGPQPPFNDDIPF